MTNLFRLVIALGVMAALPNRVYGQSLSINSDGSTADASAMLDVKSVTKGLLIPRMSRAERDAIASPATGLLIFQNAPDSIGYYYYNGSAWTWMLAGSNTDSLAWRTGGNAGTNAGANFIGTTDNMGFAVKTNNVTAIHVGTNRSVGLGTSTPGTGPGIFSRLDMRDEDGNWSDFSQTVAAGGYPVHSFIKQRGTLAAPVVVIANDWLGEINGTLYNGANYFKSSLILFQADGTVSGDAPGRIGFFTVPTGSTTLAERMTIKASGNVGIGVTTPTTYLDIAGTAAGTNSLQLRSGNSSGSFLSNQVLFGWNGSDNYRHAIKTRHHSGIPNENSIDFYLWNQGSDTVAQIGTKHAMTIDGKWKGMVGIGTAAPNSELHISDGSASLKNVTDQGGYGASILITDNIIPRIYFEAADQPADKKMMVITSQFQNLSIGSVTDNGSAWDKENILVANRDGNVGIGVAIPLVKLHVAGSGSFGTSNTNTGTNSIASGNANTISGNYSMVTGQSNTVASARSIVAGIGNRDEGENNMVSGVQNYIESPFGHSIVVGFQDTLTASSSAVFGYLNKVTAFTGFAAGDRNLVSGQTSSAFGLRNMASGTTAFVTGNMDTARGNTSAVFGTGNTAASYNELVLGMYGTNYTAASASVYNANDRILNVGNGVSGAARSDALTVLKGGNVGIGTSTPTSTLDVNGTFATTVKTAQVAGTNNPDNTAAVWFYSSGAGTITLPAAATCSGRRYVIVNQTGGALTTSAYINLATVSVTTLTDQSSIEIISDGSDWRQIK